MLTAITGFIYSCIVIGFVMYGLHLLILMILYLWHRNDRYPQPAELTLKDTPCVLIQIPLRNERFVVRAVLEKVTQLDWPKDKLCIQILDDSDDETYTLAISDVVILQELGYAISLIHRKEKIGYKAGALAVGLQYTDCEFIAIFDADFTPQPSFLKNTIPYLMGDEQMAFVQTRWEFVNGADSFLTKSQALALDAHFVIDQIARNRSQLMMNFNGTAGVWRRAAITDSGGWQGDTLAEDLDLSYRAQLKGWKCLYLPDVSSPCQLPTRIHAFLEQQKRWAKGAAQTFRKCARWITKAPNLPKRIKVMALLHLSGYVTQILFTLLTIISLPMTCLFPSSHSFLQLLGPISALPIFYYALSQSFFSVRRLKNVFYYPTLALIAISCAIQVSTALIDGFFNWGGIFIRTPKGNYDKNEIHQMRTGSTNNRLKFLYWLYGFYTIVTIYYAYSINVTHYITPNIMYLMSQIIFVVTWLTENKKREN